MKKLLEVLRLHYEGKLSKRQIEQVTKVSRRSISRYLELFNLSGLSWPLPQEYQDEESLSIKLKPDYHTASDINEAEINFNQISKELRLHKNLTLQLIHEELKLSKQMPYSYSNFTYLYRKWLNKQPNYMRQIHKAGEKIFVDYSGDKVNIIDTDSGKIRAAEIFVGVLGASNYIYLEATWSQSLSDWVMSHVRMFEHLNGSPQLVVLDNLKSGVSKPHRYNPEITPAYYHMLAYYKTAAMPARVYTPKDKAKAENGVLIVQRWILAKLRHEQIYGLSALNTRLKELMQEANLKIFKNYPETRQELFEILDKPHLRPLPKNRYIYREYKKVRVSNDYHIEIAKHYYSVPYTVIGFEIDVWYNSEVVECYYKNSKIAMHIRSNCVRDKTTNNEHMPKAHQKYAEFNLDKISTMADVIGMSTRNIVDMIISSASHKEIGVKRAYEFLKLAKKYSSSQLEQACEYALSKSISNYAYVELIIKEQLNSKCDTPVIPLHNNIRGKECYH